MKTKSALQKHYSYLLFSITGFLFTMFFSFGAAAQDHASPVSDEGEMAICKILVNNNTYELRPNQKGQFKSIGYILPLTLVPIEITYPAGRPGEKVSILIEDGGELDNGKAVQVMSLNNQKKLSFSYQVTDHAGIHRVIIEKGKDTKVVQLWVGAESAAVN